MRLRGSECVQHCALLIAGKQSGFDGTRLALLLRQKLIVLLEN
ncbi:hypothetical protein SAMN03159443_03122 [Pseudomonas sp. NFACC15-1]|nr:hypothetical protein SAMN03159443_03122 [Pseudomonas sp. NFACC15-1]SDY43286.1 hypothetical protein SAMN03159380_04076 [Pseudomonas sp. NFACC14]